MGYVFDWMGAFSGWNSWDEITTIISCLVYVNAYA